MYVIIFLIRIFPAGMNKVYGTELNALGLNVILTEEKTEVKR